MADIFDQVSPEKGYIFDQVTSGVKAPKKDIFDTVSPVQKTDVFDQITPEPSKSPSLLQRGLGFAKNYVLGNLPFMASKTALETANKIDAPIEKFRSETLPNAIAAHAPDILGTVSETGHRTPLTPEQVKPFTSLAIPTTKEAAGGALLGAVAKPISEAVMPFAEKFIPGLAESNLVKREVSSLKNIQAKNLVQPQFNSTQILGAAAKKTEEAAKDFLLPARKMPDGTIKQVWAHNEYDAAGKRLPSSGENGFIDASGKFSTIKEISAAAKKNPDILGNMKGQDTILNLRKQFIHEETDKFIKSTVGDVSVPKELTASTPGLQGTKRSFMQDLAKQVLPEESALRRQGLNGKLLADDAMHYTQDSQIMAAKAQTKVLPDLMKLPEDVRNLIPDYIDPRPGQRRPALAGKAKEVADKVKNQLKVWGRFLEGQDIEIVRKGEPSKFFAKNQFFPRALDTEAIAGNKAVYNDELRHLLNTKQVSSAEEGKQVLDAAIQTKSNVFSPQDFNNFYGAKKVSTIEKPRIYTFKNVTNDPVENLVSYFNNVSRRVNEIKYFGQHGELLHQRLASIGNEGGDANFAQGVMNRLLNQTAKDQSGDYVVRQLRAFQGATKLSLSALPNMQQGVVNSYIRSQSEPAVFKGFKNSFTEEGVNFARKAGIIRNQEADKYLEQIAGMKNDINATSVEKLADKVGDISFFKKSEEANRIQAANIGREYINELAQKFLRNPEGKIGTKTLRDELVAFRVDPDQLMKRGKLTLNEELKAANIFTGETQFGTKALGMPAIYNSSAAGKLAGQFSMFPIQQGKLTLGALKQHPLKTLPIIGATSVGIGGPLGMVSNVARGKAPVEQKSSPQKTIANYVLNSILSSGAFGKVGGVISGVNYGPESVISQMVGPTVTEAGKAAYNTGLAVKGKPKQLIKQGISQIPFVGKAAANILLPGKKK